MALSTEKKSLISAYIPAAIVSLLFSLFTVLATKVTFSGSVYGYFYQNQIDDLTIVDLALFLVLSIIYFGLFVLIQKNRPRIARICTQRKESRFSSRTVWIASSCIILFAWLIYLIAFCPGSVLGDSLSSIEQALTNSYSNHHPVLYSLIVGFFVKAGLALGNINYGIFAYAIFQSLILAATTGYVIKFMHELHIASWLLIVALLYFCIMPFFPTYAIILWKDPLFSCSLALLSFSLARFALDSAALCSKKWLFALGVACLGIMFFRNNGVVIVPIAALCVAVAFRKQAKKALVIMGSVIVFALVIQGPVYNALNISKPAVEAFGIPLQQIAYVITEDPESLTEEQKEIANKLLPYEQWSECYRPCIVDTLKFDDNFDSTYLSSHRMQVIQLWLELFVSHPQSYLKAYALSTLGFWHPYYQNAYGYVDTYILGNDYGIGYANLLDDETSESLREALTNFRPMVGSGLFVWLMLAGIALVWASRRRTLSLAYVPGLLCWLTILIATPVAFSLRYVYILALLAPLYLAMPFSQKKKALQVNEQANEKDSV